MTATETPVTGVVRVLAALPANPTKAEEVAHFNDFVNMLPKGSYLALMLSDAVSVVTRNITNDFTTDPLQATWERQRQAAGELAKLKGEQAALEAENRRLQLGVDAKNRELKRVEAELTALRASARRLAGD